MKRILFSTKKKCNFGCKYCFSQLGDYDKYFYDKRKDYSGYDVLYPACDGEIDSINFKDLLDCIKSSNKPIIVAISTKMIINNKFLKEFTKLDKALKDNGGFLKIGITITSKNYLNVFESRAASFKDRMENLKILKKNNICCGVVIRPIIPFLPKEEFEYIIDSTKKIADYYLLGGLYVFKSSSFYKEYSDVLKDLKLMRVDWLKGKPK
jgi:sulfatase maturation enzyme AslB (radical SAM superfamily)